MPRARAASRMYASISLTVGSCAMRYCTPKRAPLYCGYGKVRHHLRPCHHLADAGLYRRAYSSEAVRRRGMAACLGCHAAMTFDVLFAAVLGANLLTVM